MPVVNPTSTSAQPLTTSSTNQVVNDTSAIINGMLGSLSPSTRSALLAQASTPSTPSPSPSLPLPPAWTNPPVTSNIATPVSNPATPTTEVSTPPSITVGSGNSNAASSTATPNNNGVSNQSQTNQLSNQSVNVLLKEALEPNALNNYYQPTYHFRLFAAQDSDILVQSGNSLSQISGKKIPQITIAETGITGFNIQDVEIRNIGPNNAVAPNKSATTISIQISEPLGVSFLDALAGAATLLKVKNLLKCPYYLELSFTGYNIDGSYAGRPLNILRNFKNGGYWLYQISITNIDTSVNEGGTVYTLTCTSLNALDLTENKASFQQIEQTLTVSGNTVKEIYEDFRNKVNKSWLDNFGGTVAKPLAYFEPIQTHPIVVGPPHAIGKDPGNFKLKPVSPDKSSIRSWTFDKSGKVTCHITAGTMISDFLLSTIINTEEGQKLAKDITTTSKLDQSASVLNDRNFRECLIFGIESDIKILGYDTDHNHYRRGITMHLIPHYTQEPILSSVQTQVSTDVTTQQNMVKSLIKNGFFKKRYDYIFTGKNTEVLDFDLNFNLVWNGLLPRLAGARMDYSTEAIQSVLNGGSYPVSPKGTRPEAKNQLQVTNVDLAKTVDSQTTLQPGVTGTPPLTTGTKQSYAQIASNQPSLVQQPTTQSSSTNSQVATDVNNIIGGMFGAALPPGTRQQTQNFQAAINAENLRSSELSTNNGNNVYIEDVLNRVNNPNSTTPFPVSLWNGYLDVKNKTGAGYQGPYHRDKSVFGAVLEQVNGDDPMANKFQQILLGIRGDPFWLGQTNLERTVAFRTGKPVYDPLALPDYISGNQAIYIHFKYPLQIGDEFKPVLSKSTALSGLYYVKHVVSKFSDGGFKQELECARLILIDVNKALTNTTQGVPISTPQSNPKLANPSTVPATGTPPTRLSNT